jgi:hypothetical protein
MSVFIPDFEEKFQHLYSRHPTIINQASLAKKMDVSQALISGWKNGTVYSRPEHIPTRHIGTVCDLLNVSQELLELPNLAHFVSRIRERAEPSIWDRMVTMSPPAIGLQILRKAEVLAQPALLATQRGLYVPADPEAGVPVFHPSDEVLVRLDVEPGRHVLLLLSDRDGWQCLHPTASNRQTETNGVLLFPPQRSREQPVFARFDTVLGNQKLAAVMLPTPLPGPLLDNLLNEDDLPRTLLQLATLLQDRSAGDVPGEIVQHRFQVAA